MVALEDHACVAGHVKQIQEGLRRVGVGAALALAEHCHEPLGSTVDGREHGHPRGLLRHAPAPVAAEEA
eukprot:7593626-Alexandrium_andersonii.AAC.1